MIPAVEQKASEKQAPHLKAHKSNKQELFVAPC